jgi:hypothetical protein
MFHVNVGVMLPTTRWGDDDVEILLIVILLPVRLLLPFVATTVDPFRTCIRAVMLLERGGVIERVANIVSVLPSL